jgi:hypothetical protein
VHCSGILGESSASSLVVLLWNASVMSSFNLRNSSRGVCGSSELCPASKMGTPQLVDTQELCGEAKIDI